MSFSHLARRKSFPLNTTNHTDWKAAVISARLLKTSLSLLPQNERFSSVIIHFHEGTIQLNAAPLSRSDLKIKCNRIARASTRNFMNRSCGERIWYSRRSARALHSILRRQIERRRVSHRIADRPYCAHRRTRRTYNATGQNGGIDLSFYLTHDSSRIKIKNSIKETCATYVLCPTGLSDTCEIEIIHRGRSSVSRNFFLFLSADLFNVNICLPIDNVQHCQQTSKLD